MSKYCSNAIELPMIEASWNKKWNAMYQQIEYKILLVDGVLSCNMFDVVVLALLRPLVVQLVNLINQNNHYDTNQVTTTVSTQI